MKVEINAVHPSEKDDGIYSELAIARGSATSTQAVVETQRQAEERTAHARCRGDLGLGKPVGSLGMGVPCGWSGDTLGFLWSLLSWKGKGRNKGRCRHSPSLAMWGRLFPGPHLTSWIVIGDGSLTSCTSDLQQARCPGHLLSALRGRPGGLPGAAARPDVCTRSGHRPFLYSLSQK